MSEPQEIMPTGKNDLVGMVAQLFAEGYRLVQIGCTTLPSAYEVNYSFDKDYRFKNLRVTVAPGEEVPSISAIYPNAFLYENEIHDLFGVAIKNINIDYRGTLYRTAIKTPFSIANVKLPEPPKPKTEAPPQQKDTPKQPAEIPEGQKE
jgi:ech hydrogenase subunit D